MTFKKLVLLVSSEDMVILLLMINNIFKYAIAVDLLMFKFHNRSLPLTFDPIFQSKTTSTTTRSNVVA